MTRGLLLALLAGVSATCTTPDREVVEEVIAPPPAVSNPLAIDPADHDFSGNPKLLDRVRATPHGYFRFINRAFVREVCSMQPESSDQPTFKLHGDAHLEQYAMTESGRGLTDFDDSVTGPATIDLDRFLVSLMVACHQESCTASPRELGEAFLRGYRDGIADPTIEVPEPAYSVRIREGFEGDRVAHLAFAEKVMGPMDPEEETAMLEALESYFEAMRSSRDLDERFFDVQSAGTLGLGIGSALDRKYLVRVRGRTDDPGDDLVIELKQVRKPADAACVQNRDDLSPLRVLAGQLEIAYQPYDMLGYTRFDGLSFWVHAWNVDYAELKIGKVFPNLDEVFELAYDIGVQLGLGHGRQMEEVLYAQLSQDVLRWLEDNQEAMLDDAERLTRLTIEGWQEFVAASASLGDESAGVRTD